MYEMDLNSLIKEVSETIKQHTRETIPVEFNLCIGADDKGNIKIAPFISANCEGVSRIKFKIDFDCRS